MKKTLMLWAAFAAIFIAFPCGANAHAGDVYYTNTANDVNFIAVYAGKTLTEAKSFLKTIQATGKFKGANARKMQATINGT